ncbi:MAG: minor extracellular serine protease Vpr [Mariniflexile sp.]|jgi:minor extracellular serine protease Vpr
MKILITKLKLMKTKLLFTFFILSISINLFSQNIIGEKKGISIPPSFIYKRPLNCALNTSLLIMDIKKNKGAKYLNKKKYNLTEINSKLFVDAFIKVSNDFDKSKAELLGVKLNVKAGDFYTAHIPINNLESLLTVEGIISVDIAEKVNATMDSARTLTNVNQVQAGTGLPQAYIGNGVIVGVIDEGFDYTHPNFINLNTQQTRISRVWEQNGITTAPLPYGTEYVGTTAILSKMRDKIDVSHGTHVAGIAAGSGGIANSLYKGVANDSEIVLVSTNLTDTGVFNGIQYIFDKATSQNKPAVINMSIGKHFGPHDGSSPFDIACNDIVGSGKILVGSAGNEGSDKIHINKTLSTGNSLLSFVDFPNLPDGFSNPTISKGETRIDIWGEVGKNFEVAVNVFNISTNTYVNWTPYINTSNNSSTYTGVVYDNDITSTQDGCIVEIATENSNPNNSKPHAIIYIDNNYQDDIINRLLIEVKGTNGSVNAWHYGEDGTARFTDLLYLLPSITAGSFVRATDGNTNMTIGEIGGTGNSIISVGAFTSKNTWTSLNGQNQNKSDVFGQIASFSSKGPTVDGRIKPDITAPGSYIASSLSRFDSNYTSTSPDTVSGLTDGTNDWLFGAMQGTSMSAPMVTGIIALWLQAKPNLTVAQIKTILQNTSITNGLGSLPNNTWGRGKIDALAGAQYINQFLNVDTFDNSFNFVVYPNPTTSKVFFDNATSNFKEVSIYNYVGQKVATISFTAAVQNQEIYMSTLPSGVYMLKFTNQEGDKTVKVVKE